MEPFQSNNHPSTGIPNHLPTINKSRAITNNETSDLKNHYIMMDLLQIEQV